MTTLTTEAPSTSPATSLAMMMRALKLPAFARHAGEIAIQSAPDQGTTVTITLRAQTIEPREASGEQPATQKQ